MSDPLLNGILININSLRSLITSSDQKHSIESTRASAAEAALAAEIVILKNHRDDLAAAVTNADEAIADLPRLGFFLAKG